MAMFYAITTKVLWINVMAVTWAAKILLLPADHKPEVINFASLARSLKVKGHEPVILAQERYRDYLASVDAQYMYAKASYTYHLLESGREDLIDLTGLTYLKEILECATILSEEFVVNCRDVFSQPELMEELRRQNFDLVIVDAFELAQCLYAIPYKLDVPYVSLTWELNPWTIQLPQMPSISGIVGLNQFTAKPNFMSRLISFSMHVVTYIAYPHLSNKDEHIGEFVPEKPQTTYQDLVRNSEVILISRDNYCIDYPRLESPHVHYVGGLSVAPAASLLNDLDTFVNSATDGVIVMSFGSIATFIAEGILQKVLGAFRRLPSYKIVMRHSKAVIDAPPNVKFMSWIPQNDLLGHNKTVLFITHGGQCGQAEAHYHGVPMVVIPLFWDQQYSAARVDAKRVGRSVDHRTMTTDELYNVIRETIANPDYKQNILKCSKIIKNTPRAHDTIVWWINHVLEFGGSHLKPQFARMAAHEYFMLDILVFLFCIFLILSYVILKLCMCTVKCVKSKKAKID